jgi:hypothetical protein
MDIIESLFATTTNATAFVAVLGADAAGAVISTRLKKFRVFMQEDETLVYTEELQKEANRLVGKYPSRYTEADFKQSQVNRDTCRLGVWAVKDNPDTDGVEVLHKYLTDTYPKGVETVLDDTFNLDV